MYQLYPIAESLLYSSVTQPLLLVKIGICTLQIFQKQSEKLNERMRKWKKTERGKH